MRQISLYEAKTRLSELVEDAARGNSFVITKHGRPMATVSPIQSAAQASAPKRVGFLAEQLADFKLPEDFDTMMADEIDDMFNGSLP
jgi:prevent-host-death family protein